MRFLVDMPLSPALALELSRLGHDAVHAHNIGLGRAIDEEILERARREGRVVLTADLDHPRLLALAGSEGPGLILFRGGDFSEQQAIDMLGRVLLAFPDAEFGKSIVVVDKRSIRRRWLPVKR